MFSYAYSKYILLPYLKNIYSSYKSIELPISMLNVSMAHPVSKRIKLNMFHDAANTVRGR